VSEFDAPDCGYFSVAWEEDKENMKPVEKRDDFLALETILSVSIIWMAVDWRGEPRLSDCPTNPDRDRFSATQNMIFQSR
jgi:hypothetical protein